MNIYYFVGINFLFLKQIPTYPDMKASTHSHNCKFILLGEDDPDDQELLKEIFLSIDSSLDLVPINNGPGLLKYLDDLEVNSLPSILILDYNMPELNGAQILEILRNNPRFDSIPKIIWSTSNSDNYRNLCLKNGADDYIVKPSSMNALVEVAKHMLSFCRND